jgi:N-acetylglucosamine-6-phosphate deacetylase
MAQATLISGASILVGGEVRRRGDLLIEGRKIRRMAPRIEAPRARVVKAEGLLAAPGLIDTQINGGFGVSFSDASPEQVLEVGRRLLAHGVTSYLPTLISLPRRETLRGLRNLVAAQGLRGGARPLGIHLEGPFLCVERRGAHRESNLRKPSVAEFREYLRAAGGKLRMMTLAPEHPGALEVIREGKRRGVIMSAGHSMATAEDITRAVVRGGLSHVTHVFNAMAPLHHREETILNAALLMDRLSCGMIYDGHHLSAGMAMLLMKLKPVGSLVMVSDTTAALDAPDGELVADGERYVVKDGQVRVKGTGRLAGSAASLLDCVRSLIRDTDVPPALAIYMASGAPAKLMGLEGRKGVLRPGADADIVLLDRGMKVRMAFVEGELLHGNHH